MVWFQCEDCGDQLKKPKLINHFRQCSAYKFSCIDCGEMFDQGRVQGHTQCITEAEKYGPKGQVKLSNAKQQNKDQKQQKPEFDINVGLSDRPPWFCSFCNTKATSKQALLIHAEGKKHRAKAKAFHLSQQPKVSEESKPDIKKQNEDNRKNELPGNTVTEEMNRHDAPNGHTMDNSVGLDNGSALSKKRKAETEMGAKKTSDASGDVGNGEVVQGEGAQAEDRERKVKKAKSSEDKTDKKEDTETKIKWKKLITSALKSTSDGILKKKKLRKLVMKSLNDSGITQDEDQLIDILEHKISSSSRFSVDKKYVRLVSRG